MKESILVDISRERAVSQTIIMTPDTRTILVAAVVALMLILSVDADYIWHKDELPYDATAKCRHGVSYYTNNPKANNTQIQDELDRQLSYPNRDVCQFCVCHTGGTDIVCIKRSRWVCSYMRYININGAAREMYAEFHRQDRPALFRHLSNRMRRTMESGIYDIFEYVGSKVDIQECVPFVSEYTDCTDANVCTGCKRCTCSSKGHWQCSLTTNCPLLSSDDIQISEEEALDNAVAVITNELKDNPEVNVVPAVLKQQKDKHEEELILAHKFDDNDLLSLLRNKRSVAAKSSPEINLKKNNTVQFHHVLNELNEDTLSNSNDTGTIGVNKVVPKIVPLNLRRYTPGNNETFSISYNEPGNAGTHIVNNKIDSTTTDSDKHDILVHNQIKQLFKDKHFDIKERDKVLSKLVVNELKPGKEIVGDKDGPIISNITFTPENDTLTAMAYIAGNLLNQLWYMEKDNSEDSLEVEVMKHEKLSALLDLFKEPLTIRQELFLKNALEKLSDAITENKKMGINDLDNVSLCSAALGSSTNSTNNNTTSKTTCNKHNIVQNAKGDEPNSKMSNIMELMKKFHQIQQNIREIMKNNSNAEDSNDTNSLFGNVLEKITKLLLPSRNKKQKKMVSKIKEQTTFNNDNISDKLNDLFGIDSDQLKLSAKDKVIMDYLHKVETKPECLLGKVLQKTFDPKSSNINENIILNLSEFYKVKSYTDLIKLLGLEKNDNTKSLNDKRRNDISLSEPTEIITEKNNETVLTTEKPNVLNSTKDVKEMLKEHLKALVSDLKELQNQQGGLSADSNFDVVNILPCLYNNLQESTEGTKKSLSPEKKLIKTLNEIKKELKQRTITRRHELDFNHVLIPKVVKVWKNVINGLINQSIKTKDTAGTSGALGRKGNRRSNNELSDIETVEKMIKKINSFDNNYKNFASNDEVHPADRVQLLKTLLIEINHYINVLEKIKENINFNDRKTDSLLLQEFLDSAKSSIYFSNIILKNLKSTSKLRRNGLEPMLQNDNQYNDQDDERYSIGNHKKSKSNNKNSKPGNNDPLLAELMAQRVKLYKKALEIRGQTDGIRYKCADRVLYYLQLGFYDVAKELFNFLTPENFTTPGPETAAALEEYKNYMLEKEKTELPGNYQNFNQIPKQDKQLHRINKLFAE